MGRNWRNNEASYCLLQLWYFGELSAFIYCMWLILDSLLFVIRMHYFHVNSRNLLPIGQSVNWSPEWPTRLTRAIFHVMYCVNLMSLSCVFSPSDVNECEETNGGCEALCCNTIGSFYCKCPSGQELKEDGKTCQGEHLRGRSSRSNQICSEGHNFSYCFICRISNKMSHDHLLDSNHVRRPYPRRFLSFCIWKRL